MKCKSYKPKTGSEEIHSQVKQRPVHFRMTREELTEASLFELLPLSFPGVRGKKKKSKDKAGMRACKPVPPFQ